MRAAKGDAPAPRRSGTVTALVSRKGRTDRVAVYVEGQKAFDLSLEVADRAGLRQGLILDAEEQVRLIGEDEPHRARDKALTLLTVRDRCGKEVETRLRASGFDTEVAARTVTWLEGLGYIDDERFARAFAAERARAGWGARRIKAELLRKGVDRHTMEAILGDPGTDPEGTDEGLATVMALARKRFGAQLREDPSTAKRRLSGFLARRGYDWETIGRITRDLAREADEVDEGQFLDTP